jgi:hypothetical protein
MRLLMDNESVGVTEVKTKKKTLSWPATKNAALPCTGTAMNIIIIEISSLFSFMMST